MHSLVINCNITKVTSVELYSFSIVIFVVLLELGENAIRDPLSTFYFPGALVLLIKMVVMECHVGEDLNS